MAGNIPKIIAEISRRSELAPDELWRINHGQPVPRREPGTGRTIRQESTLENISGYSLLTNRLAYLEQEAQLLGDSALVERINQVFGDSSADHVAQTNGYMTGTPGLSVSHEAAAANFKRAAEEVLAIEEALNQLKAQRAGQHAHTAAGSLDEITAAGQAGALSRSAAARLAGEAGDASADLRAYYATRDADIVATMADFRGSDFGSSIFTFNDERVVVTLGRARPERSLGNLMIHLNREGIGGRVAIDARGLSEPQRVTLRLQAHRITSEREQAILTAQRAGEIPPPEITFAII